MSDFKNDQLTKHSTDSLSQLGLEIKAYLRQLDTDKHRQRIAEADEVIARQTAKLNQMKSVLKTLRQIEAKYPTA